MPDPRDHIGSFVDARVQPVAPPPGPFEQIRERARRRQVIRAVASVVGAAVISARLAALPRRPGASSTSG